MTALDDLFPPNLDHPYFDNHSAHPFRADAGGLSLRNAWWLAEASMLSYAEPGDAVQRFQKAGLTLDGPQPFSGASTQCYVAHTDEFVIVAFRGTQVMKPGAGGSMLDILRQVVTDIVRDADFGLVGDGAAVHRGFQRALDEVWDQGVSAHLGRLRTTGRRVWFTGHSLGAALATLAARRFGAAQGLYTFGSPLVGNQAFVDQHRVPTFRFVHQADIVTHVATFGSNLSRLSLKPERYVHVPRLKYLEDDGQLRDELPALAPLLQRLTKLPLVGPAIGEVVGLQPLEGFIDHAPLLYARAIRRSYERSTEFV